MSKWTRGTMGVLVFACILHSGVSAEYSIEYEVFLDQWFSLNDISGDGSVVVGSWDLSGNVQTFYHGIRWENGNIEDYMEMGSALLISDDGSVIIGASLTEDEEMPETIVLINGSPQTLPNLPAWWPRAISGDGKTIVGQDFDGGRETTFTWKDGVVTYLGRGLFESGEPDTLAVSYDGRVIAATSRSYNTEEHRATAWIDGQVNDLGTLQGDNGSFAYGVSNDGSMIVGSSYSRDGLVRLSTKPCYWKDGEIHELQTPNGEAFCAAVAISGDGRRILGASRSGMYEFLDRLVLWDAASNWSPVDLNSLLSGIGINLEGVLDYRSTKPWGDAYIYVLWLSADGKTIAGRFSDSGGTNFLIRILESTATWAGYPIADELMNVDTEGFMGWINVAQGDYIWSYSTNGWMYCPESQVTDTGSWVYVLR